MLALFSSLRKDIYSGHTKNLKTKCV